MENKISNSYRNIKPWKHLFLCLFHTFILWERLECQTALEFGDSTFSWTWGKNHFFVQVSHKAYYFLDVFDDIQIDRIFLSIIWEIQGSKKIQGLIRMQTSCNILIWYLL